jgi:mono/diheme cytochrome c family protein
VNGLLDVVKFHPLRYWSRLGCGCADAKRLIILAYLALLGVCPIAYAQNEEGRSLGELLYSTHCSTCHSVEIHWRAKSLSSDWSSLKAQVRRWQLNVGLEWNEDEITDVTRYLNNAYYNFTITDKRDLTQGIKMQQTNTP